MTRRSNSRPRLGRPRADGRPPIGRTDVLAAAREVFAGSGVAGATVRDIAARLGSHTASIFHQFGSKEEIVSAVVAQIYDKELARFESIRALDLAPDVALFRMIRDDALFCASGDSSHRSLFLLPELRSGRHRQLQRLQERMVRHYERVLAAGVRSRAFVAIPVRLTAEALNALAMTGALARSPESLGTSREIGSLAARLALRALLRRPGRLAAVEKAALSLDIT